MPSQIQIGGFDCSLQSSFEDEWNASCDNIHRLEDESVSEDEVEPNLLPQFSR